MAPAVVGAHRPAGACVARDVVADLAILDVHRNDLDALHNRVIGGAHSSESASWSEATFTIVPGRLVTVFRGHRSHCGRARPQLLVLAAQPLAAGSVFAGYTVLAVSTPTPLGEWRPRQPALNRRPI